MFWMQHYEWQNDTIYYDRPMHHATRPRKIVYRHGHAAGDAASSTQLQAHPCAQREKVLRLVVREGSEVVGMPQCVSSATTSGPPPRHLASHHLLSRYPVLAFGPKLKNDIPLTKTVILRTSPEMIDWDDCAPKVLTALEDRGQPASWHFTNTCHSG